MNWHLRYALPLAVFTVLVYSLFSDIASTQRRDPASVPRADIQAQQEQAPMAALAKQATLFVTHGGGPMPILGQQPDIAKFLKSAAKLLPQRPSAIVCVTAHWEADEPTVSTSAAPPMYYDYYGFPDAAYSLKYPAPGDPTLAKKVVQLLRDAGFSPREDSQRGYDHGTFVPLYLMFPEADIPVVQVSVMRDMDPTKHIQMGAALAPLRDSNVLILGSGSSFHNMKDFHEHLNTALCDSEASKSHPREEHLIPLHVVVGAAGEDKGSLAHADEGSGFVCGSWVFK